MPLIPLTLPPGVYRNGTEFQSSNRWYDANLVRWVDGTMRPVGGWRTRTLVGTTAPRAALSWSDLSNDQHLAVGFHNKLKAVNAINTVTDITPTGLVVGDLHADVNVGYGGGYYGTSTYGEQRPDVGVYGEATTWTLDTWGQNLVACSTADGRLFQWDLNVANDAVAISGAPTQNAALVVTAERFLFALGAGGNPRKVQWSDREDITTWTTLTTNEAGDIELQTVGRIMLGIRTRGQTLILTDQDAHVATYQGPPFVYGFERVGSGCGVASRHAAVNVDEGVYWFSPSGFYTYTGGAVSPVQCDVEDYIFSDINTQQASQVYGVAMTQYNEIWWFYPSAASIENDRYVVLNYAENHWSIGYMERTAAVSGGVFRNPIMLDASGTAYDHEIGVAHNGSAVYATSGPISLGAGDEVMAVTGLIPDERTQGDVSATFYTKFYPNDVARTYGPYAMANPTNVRFTGRQVRMRVEAARNTDWRVGTMRIDAQPGGRR